jgi:hypothetical protein
MWRERERGSERDGSACIIRRHQAFALAPVDDVAEITDDPTSSTSSARAGAVARRGSGGPRPHGVAAQVNFEGKV